MVGDGGGSASGATGGSALSISGFKFSNLTVKAGTTVRVTNKDAAAHTVTVSGTDIDQQVAGNGQNSFTAPSKPGQYKPTYDSIRR